MDHHFDIKIAEKYGVNAAVIYNNICYWVTKNKSENRHFYNGKHWTYASKSGLAKLFPYMTARQIDYALNKLIGAGLIICGNFSENKFERTKWYTLGDSVENSEPDLEQPERQECEKTDKLSKKPRKTAQLRITQNCAIDYTKLCNRLYKFVKCKYSNIYNIYNTYKKPYIKHTDKKNRERPLSDIALESIISAIDTQELRDELREFVKMRKKVRKPLTPHGLDLIIKQLMSMSSDTQIQLEIIRQSTQNSWLGLYEVKCHSSGAKPAGTEMRPTENIDDIEKQFMAAYSGY